MVETRLYIVDFTEALQKFHKVIADPELPTIDVDSIKYAVMSIFMQIDPVSHLQRIAFEMIKDGDLYSKDDYYTEPEVDTALAVTAEEAYTQEEFIRQYLHQAIIDLGQALLKRLHELNLTPTGCERYEVINRPFTDDTYLLKPTRPLT